MRWFLYPWHPDRPSLLTDDDIASGEKWMILYTPTWEEVQVMLDTFPNISPICPDWIAIQAELIRRGERADWGSLSCAAAIAMLTPAKGEGVPEAPGVSSDRPVWDGERRELQFRGRICRRFSQQGAENQTKILASFEELGWPASMDSPLSRNADLKQTLYRMNKSTNGIRFRGNGTGTQVSWEPVTEP